MDIVFLAFANSREVPLPTLREEDEKVYSILSRRALQQHFSIHRDSNTSIARIAEYLVLFRDYLTVFHFSGHAGRDALLLEDKPAQATGIAELLGQCPKLKLIVLNGCSTGGQVKNLLSMKSRPLVIATSAPVGDPSATQFAISFYQALSEQYYTVAESFQAGMGAAQTVAAERLAVRRGAGIEAMEGDIPLWGLFCKDESGTEWRLPDYPYDAYNPAQEPNAFLITQLIENLAPHNKEVEKIREDESLGAVHNILDKREAILKSLPHPISEQLRKLLVPESEFTKAIFYDKPGPARLRQMTVTYDTVIELLAFILLAQLWDALAGSEKLRLSGETQQTIQSFFLARQAEQATYDYLPLIRQVGLTLQENHTPFFIPEMKKASLLFEEQSDFCSACKFMEKAKEKMLPTNGLSETEALQLCRIAEEKLAMILGRLGFIARYTLASVKDIDVIKYRHSKVPKFKHKLVKLVQRFVGLAEEQQVLEKYMDTASVLLLNNGAERRQFLNLSPFLIDENAFDEKAAIAKLYFFDHYEKGGDAYCYKHVYKPNDQPLMIRQQANFRIIKSQFDSFAQLIFQQPMKEAV
ncbi:MAG: CHAT domain-containing protein [Lewinellaceae bacterium]|nr:CHAT domain-containing protein [Phaeodactylibacter sp.]MCB0612525.1 CHAT domain-containing protein [Phaeodactylibacter sp.]MCB9351760.1 CHAT domain-containing protein [Lewinellaceae bacterium]